MNTGKSADQLINEFLRESARKRSDSEAEKRAQQEADAKDCRRENCAEHRRDWTDATPAEIDAEMRRLGVRRAM